MTLNPLNGLILYKKGVRIVSCLIPFLGLGVPIPQIKQ